MNNFTIIIPHKHGSMNDECLNLCCKMLKANTNAQYELIVDDRAVCPYRIWNELVPFAKYETVIMSNTDVLFAPGWEFLGHYVPSNSIVTGYLVECGALDVHPVNIYRDFGCKPSTFDRTAFERFVNKYSETVPLITYERGWYMPCAVNRDWFMSSGGFEVDSGRFPDPLDIWFWEKCLRDQKFRLMRVRSFAYHFQNLSDETRCHR